MFYMFGVKNESDSRALPILAAYIFGKNKGERKFAMTAPVTQRAAPVKTEMMAPVTQAAVPGGRRVQFVLPEGVTLESAPEPLDPREPLRLVPGSHRATIPCSGTWSQANCDEHRVRMLAAHAGALQRPHDSLIQAPQRNLIGTAMNPAISRRCTWVALLLAASTALAQPAAFAERYSPAPTSADGIGKRYMGREISAVMGWQGAAWLERDERDREERTDLLLAALALQPGMVVADIGAGTGYLSRRMAPAVMPGGKVWAVDVQPEMISLLQASAKRSGLTQIEARLGTVDDVRLPAASVDLAVMVDVYHELACPYEVMTSVLKALKPGGRVVFVEYKAEDPRVPIKPRHKMSEAQIKREAAVFALDWERTVGTLPWQHVVVFRKRN